MEIVNGEEGTLAFHSIGGDSVTHVHFISEEHVASPEEIGALPEGRVRNLEVAESG